MADSHLDRMESSMAPPHLLGSRIHLAYSAVGLPSIPSLYCEGSCVTASAITCLLARPLVSETECNLGDSHRCNMPTFKQY